jgi:hypothetical protein
MGIAHALQRCPIRGAFTDGVTLRRHTYAKCFDGKALVLVISLDAFAYDKNLQQDGLKAD